MNHDPILAEVRRTRDAYAAALGHDLETMFRDAQALERDEQARGRAITAPPPRAPEPTDHVGHAA